MQRISQACLIGLETVADANCLDLFPCIFLQWRENKKLKFVIAITHIIGNTITIFYVPHKNGNQFQQDMKFKSLKNQNI